MRCSACKSVSYCGKECATAAWKQGHKKDCKRLRERYSVYLLYRYKSTNTDVVSAALASTEAQGASTSSAPITWRALEELGGATATGKVLEIRVMTQPMPPFLRSVFEGKDRQGEVRRSQILSLLALLIQKYKY